MPTFSFWMLALGVVVFVAWAYSPWALQRPISLRLRRSLALLRILFLLALVGLLAGPRVRREIERLKAAHLAVLIDDSESMNLPVTSPPSPQGSRLERAKGLFDKDLMSRLGKKRLTVSFWRASDLMPIQSPAELTASAPTTHLGRALSDLAGKFDPGDLKAILLATDGQNTGGESPTRVAGQIGVPVFALGLGPPEAAREVGIDELIVPEQAFPGESIPIHVVLSQRGAADEQPLTVRLRVMVDGELSSVQSLPFAAGQLRYDWKTEKAMDSPGHHRVEVDIQPDLPPAELPSQKVQETRWRKSTELTILKERYRVVLLSGRPAWDTKFARRAFEEDPRLDVLALWPKADGRLALVTPTARAEESAKETPSTIQAALEADPRIETLLQHLSAVDLLILGNLTLKGSHSVPTALTPERIQKLTDWVDRQGGALLVIGGEEMFGAGGADFAPLEPLLPVSLRAQYDYRTGPVFPRLTEFGRRSDALASWRQIDLSRLGPLETSHLLGKPKLGAEVLLEEEAGNPLLAWHSFGAGRVMVLATDSFWRYGLPLAERDLPAELFGNFWRELARFLMLERRGSGVRLYTDGQRYFRGEEVRVWANIDSNLQVESPAARIPLELRTGASTEAERIFLSQNPQSPTLYEGSFRPQQLGSYRLRLDVHRSQDEKQIQVTAPEEEYRRLSQNVALLQDVAQRSGGQYLQPSQLQQLPSEIQFRPETETLARSVFLGSLPWVLPLLLGLITTEWILRKRASLP